MNKTFELKITFESEQELISFISEKQHEDLKNQVMNIPLERRYNRNLNKRWTEYEDNIVITEYKKHPTK